MDETKAEPGWYPHPQIAGRLRYWDGAEWTAHTAPASPQAPAGKPAGTLTIARGVALGVGAVIAVLLLVGQCAAQNNDTECATQNAERALNGQPALSCD